MEGVQNLVKTTLGEIEKMLTTKTVVGEAVTVEGATIIPLVSFGFGFGAGGGSGENTGGKKGAGSGGGTMGGGGIKPVALVIIDNQGVRVESIMGSFATAIEKVGGAIPNMVTKFIEKKSERKKGA